MISNSINITNTLAIPASELEFQFTRSGGPGGQNVNKVSTRVELLFNVLTSPSLTDDQRARIKRALGKRIDSSGLLHIAVQDSRSQWRNREDAIERFTDLIREALKPRKKRIPTGATKGSKQRRLQGKKLHGAKKQTRGRVSPE
ncbi:MAG: alternative ribosome rescue aminoacyl-tRNA hydrolase ArfB [Bacteroidota bacterium]